jgi:hypothetical protein
MLMINAITHHIFGAWVIGTVPMVSNALISRKTITSKSQMKNAHQRVKDATAKKMLEPETASTLFISDQ